MATTINDNRSIGELFSELSAQTSTLIRKEVELARHEMTRSVVEVARSSALIAGGAVIGYAGALVVLVGIAWGLADAGLPRWLAFVLVGVVTLLVGAGLALWARQRLTTVSVVPNRTVETIRDDVEWAKEKTE
jgi:cation transporter-like permease